MPFGVQFTMMLDLMNSFYQANVTSACQFDTAISQYHFIAPQRPSTEGTYQGLAGLMTYYDCSSLSKLLTSKTICHLPHSPFVISPCSPDALFILLCPEILLLHICPIISVLLDLINTSTCLCYVMFSFALMLITHC